MAAHLKYLNIYVENFAFKELFSFSEIMNH